MPVDERAGRIYSRREILQMVLLGTGFLAGCRLPGSEVPVTTPTVDIPTPAAVPTSTSVVVVERTATPVVEATLPVVSPVGRAPTFGQLLIVRGTGGAGAPLRAEPSWDASVHTMVPEYTQVTRIGSDRIIKENVWRHVEAPSKHEGWMAASYLSANIGPVAPPILPVPKP